MPDHAAAPVPCGSGGFADGSEGSLDSVELMVSGHLLDHLAVSIIEDNEVPYQVQEAALLEDPPQQRLKLGHCCRCRGHRHRYSSRG